MSTFQVNVQMCAKDLGYHIVNNNDMLLMDSLASQLEAKIQSVQYSYLKLLKMKNISCVRVFDIDMKIIYFHTDWTTNIYFHRSRSKNAL